ncbi:c-type cytochrome [Paraburkholderia metrosideri]|jgi:mono/diheme cytochrome c family protein|uniref:Fructose dehydrogenase cytochrome subunit n=1 Tax=Paraburkholderia metrosideri TaxID=580937 RepID=A0ABM8NMI9_9BURK|nr:cytochrome c [Paraburkholderia metrosideri]CAD6533405.1 Fructose dehydrogenase cytochrome subunit [Paraburkholderia metrosideri]
MTYFPFTAFKRHLCAALFASVGLVSAAHAADDDLVKRGEYLAKAGDCIACHSAPQGKPFAGGLPLATPLGEIVSTNITPSRTNGIGNYTLEQFSAALRQGVRADGQHLYPAMPYTSYAKVSDDDVKALYAYFMHGVAPVDTSPPPTQLPFPFNVRLSMAAWNLLFLDHQPFQADPAKSVEWNRGAYLVQGLAHCSTCHTPRNALMAEDTSAALGGSVVGTWYAPNVSSDPASGIGSWSEEEIAAYLRTGHVVGRAQAAGPMAEAVDNSFQHLSDSDLRAMAVYLKSSPPVHHAGDRQAADTWGSAKSSLDEIRGVPLPADANQMSGPQIYDAYCASCHQAHGEGAGQGIDGPGLPSLFHNTALGHANTNNLVMVMLEGVHRQDSAPDVLMPAFGRLLSDQQIATLGNYLLKQYGNPDASVTVQQVKTLRQGGEASPLIMIARVGMAVAALIVLGIVVLLIRRR